MNDNYVRIDRNLTVKRLPECFRNSVNLRLVVWEIDPLTNTQAVWNIYEGTRNQMINAFNQDRFDFGPNMHVLVENIG